MLLSAACLFGGPADSEPVPRNQSAAGAVIARKSGEEVRFIDVSAWRFVDLNQDLLPGDVLRTNEAGQLAILFSDRTQIRLGRNSTLVVKQITSDTRADTVLQLQTGTIWARAERGGTGVRVETAAAAAAIRGTDWTMTVNGTQTSLNVLEGLVQLSNAQGSVDVLKGEGAAATLGQAPHKIVVIDSDDREQMLFYLPPREAFLRMSPSAQPIASMRRNADRILATAPDRRSTEDWVTLAEAQLSLEGRGRARETLEHVRTLRLSPSLAARVTLLDAVLAACDGHYAEAAKMFERAQRSLSGDRRSIALYGGYYARSLANPARAEPLPPQVGGPDSAFLRAYAIGFLKDLKAAIAELKSAERRFPNDPTLPAYRAWLAILLNDRSQAQEAIQRSLDIDPSEPTAIEARAQFRSGFQGDETGALKDLDAVLAVTPGSSSTWNEIGNIQSSRGATREAETAFKTAIELDPNGALSHANLAIFYLDTGRMDEARREIDAAFAADPSLDIGLLARGRYKLQTGDVDGAIGDFLAGSVANPTVAAGQLLLAAGLAEKGDRIGAAQALDNADRLDDDDPTIPAVRTAIAIDDCDADEAMASAREYLKRSQARGGDYTSLGASRDAGSTLNNAFRLQGLDAWGQYYGDVVFDPFAGTSYLDQVVRGNVNPLANAYDVGGDIINNTVNTSSFSSLVQGLLLEPHMLAGRSLSAGLVQRPFLEGSVGGGVTTTSDDTGRIGSIELQGYSNLPVPTSGYLLLDWEELDDTTRSITNGTNSLELDHDTKLLSGTAYLTTSPTPNDRFVAYASRRNSDDDLDLLAGPGFLEHPYGVHYQSTAAGLGWSHTIGYHDIVNAALFYTSAETHVDDSFTYLPPPIPPIPPIPIFARTKSSESSYVAAVNHLYGDGDFSWRYGLEGGWIDASSTTSVDSLGVPLVLPETTQDRVGYGRIYVDLLHEITPDLKAEYGLHGVLMQGDAVDVLRAEPRIGLAWAPVQGQWLRAGYIREGVAVATPTLSPIGVVGLQPNGFGVGIEGYADTFTMRWDAEWSDRLFTAVDYQHQIMHDISVSDVISQNGYDYAKATVDRIAFTANLALGHGFGLTGTYAFAQSSHNQPAPYGEELPFLPEHSGQVALTWVNSANVKATLAANYVGERQGDNSAEKLDDYWTLDAKLTWEPLDKHLEFEAAAYNLLDEDFQVASGANGWGRVFKGTLKVRF